MYGPPGHAYVYFIYGMHHCLNAVAGQVGDPTAVLIRAGEPLHGLEQMRANRRWTQKPVRAGDLCGGPGKLCQALDVDRSQDGVSLTGADAELFLAVSPQWPGEIVRGPRVGVAYAGEAAQWPLRYALAGNPHVSRPRLPR